MKSEELDKKFESGESILDHLDLSTARRPNQKMKRVNIDFPEWMVKALDKESNRVGVTRQSIIKIWISQKIDVQMKKNNPSPETSD